MPRSIAATLLILIALVLAPAVFADPGGMGEGKPEATNDNSNAQGSEDATRGEERAEERRGGHPGMGMGRDADKKGKKDKRRGEREDRDGDVRRDRGGDATDDVGAATEDEGFAANVRRFFGFGNAAKKRSDRGAEKQQAEERERGADAERGSDAQD